MEKTNDWSETVTKPYGKRRFTYTEKSGGISGFEEAYSRFGYTVSDDGLSARYIKGKGQSKWYGQIKTNMAVKIKSWNKTKKKMVVEHHVAKYKK